MKKLRNNIIVISMLCLCAIVLYGCSGFKGYEGEYPELYTEACCSLQFSQGCLGGERIQPAVDLLETDDYGRQLFSYYEKQNVRDSYIEGKILSLLICQKSDNDYVYYYEDVNYVSINTQKSITLWENPRANHFPDPLSEFEDEQIALLKEANDWNTELQLDKCTKRSIITEKRKMEVSFELLQLIGNDINAAHGTNYEVRKDADLIYMDTDENGLMLFNIDLYVRSESKYYYFAIITDSEMNYNKDTFSCEIVGPFNCQEKIIRLKEDNGWVTL